MPLLAFLMSVAFVPGIMGASTAPRWALLSLTVPLLMFFIRVNITAGHVVGMLFVAWCAITVAWSETWDSVDGLWKLLLLAGLFCYGARAKDHRGLWLGLGLGAAVNCLVMIPQAFGWQGLPQISHPGGLFYSSGWAAEFCALVLVGLIGQRLWWLVPFPAVAIALTTIRGALMGLAGAFVVWVWGKSKGAALALSAVFAAAGLVMLTDGSHNGSGLQRLLAWRDTVSQLTWHGTGLGSYAQAYPEFGFMFSHAHNDLLQIAAETGIGVFLFCAFIAVCMFGSGLTERCVLACFMVEGLVGYPLYMPATAFVAAIVAGRLCSDGVLVRDSLNAWRGAFFTRQRGTAGEPRLSHLPGR